jgi:hypothetical protein
MTRSIPIEKCLEGAMLVYSQNGERLRPQQGYPLRLLLPGFEGNMSIKWLRRLHVAAEPAYSREETSKYTDLMPDGSAREFTFFMEAKSIITRPSGGQRLNSPGSMRSAVSPGCREILRQVLRDALDDILSEGRRQSVELASHGIARRFHPLRDIGSLHFPLPPMLRCRRD